MENNTTSSPEPRIVTLIDDVEKERDSFLEKRKRLVGSSDIAAICGLNKYRSPMQVWAEKTGRLEAQEDNDILWLGRELEPVVAKLVARKNELWSIERCGRMFSREDIPWASCTPDYSVVDFSHTRAYPLEIKTTGSWAAKAWEEGIPDSAHCQVQWQMGIGGFETSVVAALIGGRDYVEKRVDFDPEVFQNLVSIGEVFMKHVNEDTPPPALTAEDGKMLDTLYGVDKEKVITFEDDMVPWIVQWQSAQEMLGKLAEEVKHYEAEVREAKVRLQDKMRGAHLGLYGNKTVKMTKVNVKGYFREPTSYITLKLGEVKE